MLKRPAGERGHADHGWLDTYHTFSFADYHDPKWMGFSRLRVINQDRVAPGRGFATHGHQDMEIVTWVLSGELAHRDSMGNGSVIRPGECQLMSAGTGVTHSEFNASNTDIVELLQMWLLPAQRGTTPRYEQRSFSLESRTGRLCLVASPDARDGSVRIGQDVDLYTSSLSEGDQIQFELHPGRSAWLHVAHGTLSIDDQPLTTGDGAGLTAPRLHSLVAHGAGEIMLFDLPA